MLEADRSAPSLPAARWVNTFLTFAYGANMSARALGAKGVVPLRSCRAWLPDAELALRIPLFPPFVGHVADVRWRPGASLPGVVHEFPATVMPKIDAWEGAGWVYDVELLDVQTSDGPVRARTYVACPEFIGDDGPCTERYHGMLMDGARESQLPDEHLERLRALPIVETPARVPGCLSSVEPAPAHPSGEWFEVAGAVFSLPPDALFAQYLRRYPPAGGVHHLTQFFLQYDAASEASERNVPWSELSEREQAFLGPFMWRMEQHFAFLGWTRSALGSRDCR